MKRTTFTLILSTLGEHLHTGHTDRRNWNKLLIPFDVSRHTLVWRLNGTTFWLFVIQLWQLPSHHITLGLTLLLSHLFTLTTHTTWLPTTLWTSHCTLTHFATRHASLFLHVIPGARSGSHYNKYWTNVPLVLGRTLGATFILCVWTHDWFRIYTLGLLYTQSDYVTSTYCWLHTLLDIYLRLTTPCWP